MSGKKLKLPGRCGAGDTSGPDKGYGAVSDAGRTFRKMAVVGAAGAGKSRFVDEAVRLNRGNSYRISAIGGLFPEREESELPGSIDRLFREAVERQPYIRTDAVSELDKLIYMLFADEFETLLSIKSRGGKAISVPTKLDRVTRLWEEIFPGNRIVREKGTMMFSTASGENLIEARRLSRSEQAVLYYSAAVMYAMPGAVVFVDSPSVFLHPTVQGHLWDSIEALRPDCTFIYDTVDVAFVSSRNDNACIWVKSFDSAEKNWDYEILSPGQMSDGIFVDLIGSRKPVLFIEGDARHSIDARLYPLVFPEWTVRPLGSCDKVIESTRTFNDLKNMHHVESRGIVDRDRRTDAEVGYLRRKSVMVPEVAEVENLFLVEGVVRAMAERAGKTPDKVFSKVRNRVENEFARRYDEQALQHVRHRVKREVECKIDARFTCITAMELHLKGLPKMLRPREQYNQIRGEFKDMLRRRDYASILRVFNHKPMLADSGVAQLTGFKNRDEYISGVIGALRGGGTIGRKISAAIAACFPQG